MKLNLIKWWKKMTYNDIYLPKKKVILNSYYLIYTYDIIDIIVNLSMTSWIV